MESKEPPVIPFFGSAGFHRDPRHGMSALHGPDRPRLYRHPYGPELVLVGYGDLQQVLKHPAMQAQNRDDRSSGPAPSGALARLFDAHPVFMNEPRHRPVRLAATSVIGVGRNEWLALQVSEVSATLIGNLKRAGGGDLVNDFAFALSSRVWCRILGIGEQHAPTVQDCARRIAVALEFQPATDALSLADAAASTLLELLADSGQSAGSDSSSAQLIRDSMNRVPDPDSATDALQLLASLTFDAVDGAGGMTGNLLYCLLTDEAAMGTARMDGADLAPFWTEAARLHPPLLGLFRCAIEDTDFDGITLKAGQNVLTLNAAGNRDPAVFSQPHDYVPSREPNRPLSFGFGGRGCIGRYLAQLQGTIGTGQLLQAFPRIHRQPVIEDWGKPGLLRAIQSLPVELG